MDKILTHGYVYILESDKTEYVKIGGTDYLPEKRCKEIDKQPPYSQYAPWRIVDYREICNWREVEHHIHYIFRDSLVTEIPKQKELFCIDAAEASHCLERIDPTHALPRPKIDRMFHHQVMSDYLVKLFTVAGCDQRREKEGVWTFTLFPGTHSGHARFFTINIHSHEVAFCTKSNNRQWNMLHVDNLILKYKSTLQWVKNKHGEVDKGPYKTALPKSKSVSFMGDFTDCLEFLDLPGVRESIVKYWDRALEKYNSSIQSKYHNYEATAEIIKRMKENNR